MALVRAGRRRLRLHGDVGDDGAVVVLPRHDQPPHPRDPARRLPVPARSPISARSRILLCFGVLQANTGDYTFANMRAQQLSPFWASVAFLLALFGFGAKAGIAAAAHLAARGAPGGAVAGVGADERRDAEDRRSTACCASPSTCCTRSSGGGACCCSRSASPRALFGVVFAAVQVDMKRLLAYSSIENIGLHVRRHRPRGAVLRRTA